ncbi:MAG: hypothetical protein WA705_29570 [Candidatus Ozemobacteraceae bacterium]
MNLPAFLWFLVFLDTFGLLAMLVAAGTLLAFTSVPFSLLTSLVPLVLAAQFAFMLYTIIAPNLPQPDSTSASSPDAASPPEDCGEDPRWERIRVGYYDHIFLWTLIFTLASVKHPSVGGPFVAVFFLAMLSGEVRDCFGLIPFRTRLFDFPIASLFFPILFCVLAFHVFVREGFLLAAFNLGILRPLASSNGLVALFVLGGMLLTGSFAAWKPVYYVIPLWVFYLFFGILPWSALAGLGFLLLWLSTANRDRFRIGPIGWKTTSCAVIAALLFLGIAEARIPIAFCQRHGTPVYLYRVWQSPGVGTSSTELTAFFDDHIMDDLRTMRGDCRICDAAMRYRAQRARCILRRQEFCDRLSSLFRTETAFPAATTTVFITVTSGTLTIPPEWNAQASAVSTLIIPSDLLPCMYQAARTASQPDNAPAMPCEMRFEQLPGSTAFSSHCAYCETYGF